MYPFDLSRFGAFDFALFLLYAKQEDTGAVFLHLARFAAFDVAAVPLGETQAVIEAFCAQLRAELAASAAPPEPPDKDEPPTIQPIAIEFSADGVQWTPLGPPRPLKRRHSEPDAAAEDTAKRLIDQALGEGEADDKG